MARTENLGRALGLLRDGIHSRFKKTHAWLIRDQQKQGDGETGRKRSPLRASPTHRGQLGNRTPAESKPKRLTMLASADKKIKPRTAVLVGSGGLGKVGRR
jgi:hypothetical protein